MFWRLNCLAAILFTLCCTSSTFWLGSATDEQNKAPNVDHHKLTETQQYESGKETDPKHDHEQFLGKDEAKQYEELTPEKSKERLAKLVPKMDLNSDGQVEEGELREHINFMQKRYVNNDVERTWKNYKEEQLKDGLLDWQDYRNLVYGKQQEGQEMAPEYTRMIERDERRWKVADYNSDGKLDRTEYGCFMHPEDCDHMRDIVVQETVEDIDKDKDGFVDMAEYIGDMYRPDDYPELNGKEPEWVQSERDMFKEHRDKDKDGKLNKACHGIWCHTHSGQHISCAFLGQLLAPYSLLLKFMKFWHFLVGKEKVGKLGIIMSNCLIENRKFWHFLWRGGNQKIWQFWAKKEKLAANLVYKIEKC